MAGMWAASLASGQQPDQQAAFDAWWDRVWGLAQSLEPTATTEPSGLVVAWRHAEQFIPAPEELAQLRAETQRHPQHPMRSVLRVYDARARGELAWTRLECWVAPGLLRVNTDPPQPDAAYHDLAVGADGAWSLVPEQLILSRVDTARPEADFASSARSVASRGLGLVTGGLANAVHEYLIGRPAIRLEASRWTGRWEGRTVADRPMGVTLQGAWHEEGWGSVDRLDIHLELPDGGRSVVRYASQGWSMRDSGWAAPQVLTRTTDGRPDWTAKLESFRSEATTRISDLTGAPGFERADPVRGTLAVAEITDLRGQAPRVVKRTPRGPIEIDVTKLPAHKEARRFDAIGWAIIVALASGFAVFLSWKLKWLSRRSASERRRS